MSEIASYKKRVFSDVLMSALTYEKRTSNTSLKDDEGCEVKKLQVQMVKDKLLRNCPATSLYHMSWWRTCDNEGFLSICDEQVDGIETVSYPLTQHPQNEQLGDPKQIDTDKLHDEDEKFCLFRNQAAKKVLHSYLSVLGSWKKDQTEDQDVERIIIAWACLDVWIMAVVTCLTDADIRGGRLQKLYIEKFAKYLPIFMGQICGSIYWYVD